MKKIFFAALITSALSIASFTSCMSPGSALGSGTVAAGTAAGANTAGAASDILGSLLGTLIGNAVPVNEQSIVGTWVYASPEVRFESENLLAQAGGEVAAVSIERKLEEMYGMVGIQPGTSGFIFNADKTCTIALGQYSINGTYSVDTKTNTINIVSSTGLMKLSGKVYFGLNQLVILFDGNKILSVAQTLAAFTGKGGSSIGSIGAALGNYKGLMLGMNLQKQQ